MLKNDLLAKSVRFALIGGAATAALSVAPVFAAEEEKAKVERIQVTGSRLNRTDFETATPVTTITGKELEDLGIQDVGQFLQSSAAMNGSPATTTRNNGGSGATTIELRGLGSSRTLLLVNGRRTVSSDFQTIPSSIIERIEILKDGASATYGADAVAGVVNIITKRNFEGVEFSAQTKQHFSVDAGNQNSFSLLAGKAFDDGHLVFNVDYVKQDEIYQGDVKNVDFFQSPWVVYGGQDSFEKNGLITEGPNANNYYLGSGSIPCGNFYLFGKSGSYTNGACQDSGTVGNPTLADMRKYTDKDSYNYNPVNYLQTPYEKLNVYVDGHFEYNDNVTLFTETRFNKRESRQELAAVPFDTRFDPGYIVKDPTTGDEFNGVSKDNYYNPFGEDVKRSRRRMLEGGRSFEQNVVQFQQVFGAEIALTDTLNLDLSYNYGHRQVIGTDFGQLYGPHLSNALGASFEDENGNIVCGTPDSPISGCVSLNVFGGPGTVSQEMLDYITAPLVSSSTYNMQVFNAFLSGDLIELPAGTVAAGIGYEYRNEKGASEVDSGQFFDQVTGNTGKGTRGDFNVSSVFSEISIPLLEDAPLAQRVDLDLGLRYDDFSAFGGEFTYQAKLKWKVNDELLMRSTYGTVFRAPGVGSLYSPPSDSFPSASDPCRQTNWATLSAASQAQCVAGGVPQGGVNDESGQQRGRVGGNPGLQAESGDTFTLGLAYSPDYVENLGITLDYWAINIDNVITSVSVSNTLSGCYSNLETSFCESVFRDSTGQIDYVEARSLNQSKQIVKGLDFEASYALETGIGDFNFNLVWSHNLERQEEDFDYVPQVDGSLKSVYKLVDLNGKYTGDTAYAEDKANFTIAYSMDDLTITYRANYISGMTYNDLTYLDVNDLWSMAKADTGTGRFYNFEIPSFVYHDIAATYTFPTDTRLSFGISNLTEEQPPYIENALNGNTDESTYRLFGRSWYLGVTQKF